VGYFARAFIIVALLLAVGLIGTLPVFSAETALPGTASQANPISVTVVGSACVSGTKTHGMVEEDALADARKKGREYAVNEVEAKTTLENGAPDTDLMAAYMEGKLREISPPKKTWSSDSTLGDCCEVQVRLELLPKLNRTVIKPVKNSKVTKGVYVESDPSGAEVFIDGLYQGTAPIQNSKISPGRHKLELLKVAGYQEYHGSFEVKSGHSWKYRVVLGKKDVPPDIPSNHSPASVVETGNGSGSAAGRAPNEGRPATVMEPTPAPVIPPAVDPVVVDIRQWVAVKVMTEPVSTKIYLDDKFIGDSPAEFLAVVGRHHLRLVPGSMYQVIEKDIDVDSSHLNALFLRLDSK
jgi:hypothetical protein